MRHGSLFSGIGGFDLAAEWMGWENVFHCEWNEFGQKVLKYHFPNAESFNDITKTDFTKYANTIDILTGGFPCQPFSLAGKRKGTSDERYLWGEMLRAIREIKPKWVIAENVFGITNIDGGMVFEQVCLDLEAEGYEVQPFIIPAAAKNAPHRRDRCWFIAYASSNGYDEQSKKRNNTIGKNNKQSGSQWVSTIKRFGNERNATDTENARPARECVCRPGQIQFNRCYTENVPNTNNEGLERRENEINYGSEKTKRKQCNNFTRCFRSNFRNFPTVSPLRQRDDGVSKKLLRFVVNNFYETISYTSQENRIKNLQEVRKRIQSEEIWQQIRGFYSLESKDVLLQTMQLYSSERQQQRILSPFSEKLCEPIMQHLRKYKEFRCSPQGQELEKQRSEKFGNSLSFLPHEIALAARRFETAISKFEAWHRNESIKAYGNAIVPQIAYELFKIIANETARTHY